MINLTWPEYMGMIDVLDQKLLDYFEPVGKEIIYIAGIPRGGMFAALLLTYRSDRYEIVDPDRFDLRGQRLMAIIDDVLETGKTRSHWQESFAHMTPAPLFAVLIDKSPCYPGQAPAGIAVRTMTEKEWVCMPYENSQLELEAEKGAYVQTIVAPQS